MTGCFQIRWINTISHRRIVAPMRLLPTKSARPASAAGAVPSIIYVRLFTICSPKSQAPNAGRPHRFECRYYLKLPFLVGAALAFPVQVPRHELPVDDVAEHRLGISGAVVAIV